MLAARPQAGLIDLPFENVHPLVPRFLIGCTISPLPRQPGLRLQLCFRETFQVLGGPELPPGLERGIGFLRAAFGVPGQDMWLFPGRKAVGSRHVSVGLGALADKCLRSGSQVVN